MFVFGFNLKRGFEFTADGHTVEPPVVRGIGIGWSKASFTEFPKHLPEEEKPANEDQSLPD